MLFHNCTVSFCTVTHLILQKFRYLKKERFNFFCKHINLVPILDLLLFSNSSMYRYLDYLKFMSTSVVNISVNYEQNTCKIGICYFIMVPLVFVQLHTFYLILLKFCYLKKERFNSYCKYINLVPSPLVLYS